MKKIKIQYIFFVLMLLMMGACKKDVKSDISKNDDRDIRVLKVQYLGHDYDASAFGENQLMYTKECTYHYDSDGHLSYIMNDDILRAQVEYNNDQIKVTNGIEQNQIFSSYWDNSIIKSRDNKIDNIMVTTLHLSIEPQNIITQDGIDISRKSDGKLKSVLLEGTPDVPVTSSPLYYGLATEILSYNDNGLPDKLETPFFYWSDPDYYTADFTFQYNRAEDVPMKLKRLVNEELLFSNRYGITNFDLHFIDSTRNFSQLGEGNWLISFGFPQLYILEEKSEYLVSKRTSTKYKGGINENSDPDGSKEYFKTIVHDFPYIHNPKEKTLEIAGLKIWYEYVDNDKNQ
ncbi:MAG: hypothetical protein M9958_04225 [Chitinophagales bacterium]|nr:hypothetical protein [Chitinophagales bacterium]